MKDYISFWYSAAKTLFSQAFGEEMEFAESPSGYPESRFSAFAATLKGRRTGRFIVYLDSTIFDAPLFGSVADQTLGWRELLREVAGAAAGDLLIRTGDKCEVAEFVEVKEETQPSRAFQLRLPAGTWTILVRDEVSGKEIGAISGASSLASPDESSHPVALSAGVELLLDVELEAAIRFGYRELTLSEVLDMGPGDVVELDRHVSDPVDLVVGDKVVAQGEVVLVNGSFGLRVTAVAVPRKRLESIRCLF
jgi:flagellar motor switch protein FliN